ncbi:MAG: NAD(P)/FAD-dependent oxidoreductase [Acetobacteraceae bacterium]
MAQAIDRTSLAGKEFPLAGHSSLVVLGAGPAGVAAALEARLGGLDVLLVDEHPVASALIGLDVPYMFGERLDPAAHNKPRMLERVLTGRPEIAALFEAGVDVALGTYVWGAFVDQARGDAPQQLLLGLADEEHSWLVSCDRLIVAAGARDLALAFPGWDRPGVVGARGFAAALTLYQAFSGRRIVVLGAGALGLGIASNALDAGIAVAGIVDVQAAASAGPALDGLTRRGIPICLQHRVMAVGGAREVEGISIAPLGRPHARVEIACDTVVSALDVVPMSEVFALLGCKIVWHGELGGFVPEVDDEGRTTVSGVYAAGDCTGVTDRGLGDPESAALSGRRAARAAARDRGGDMMPLPMTGRARLYDRTLNSRSWLEAHLDAADETMICRCEGVSRGDLLGVRPPRYLRYDTQKLAVRDLYSLGSEGPVNQDQVKRLTRVGMGACQGRRCREQVHLILTLHGNQPPGSVAMPSYRAPLRPLPLAVLSAHDETAEMRAHWVTWSGIPSQWLPHWEKAPDEDIPSDHRIGLPDVGQ